MTARQAGCGTARGVVRVVPCLVAVTLLLAGCTVPAPVATPAAPPAAKPAAPAGDPFADLLANRATGSVLRFTDDALIAITVRRGGALARLGHDHVVAARRIGGGVDPVAGLAALRFRLDEMTVDEAALRHEAGLTTQPSTEAIAGTRVNMLTRVLDAERHPFVEVRARRAAPSAPMQADITLHGVTRRYQVPVTIDTLQGGVTARGTLILKQTDFGITPFSVLGGAMAVQDALEIRFVLPAHLVLPARPVPPDAVR